MNETTDLGPCPNCGAGTYVTQVNRTRLTRCANCGTARVITNASGPSEYLEGQPTVIEGTGLSSGSVRGPVVILSAEAVAAGEFILYGDEIIVIESMQGELTWVKDCGGIVATQGDLTSQAGVMSRELEVPAIGECPEALDHLIDGLLVELDGSEGELRIIDRDRAYLNC